MCRLTDVRPRDYRFSGIYRLTNTANGKVYIGQSKNIGRRMSEYQNGHFNVHLSHAVLHYGIDVIDMDVVERCAPEKLDDREEYWIAFYDSTDQSKGYNICKRSTQRRGIKLPSETRERMRQSMLARLTDEYRAKLLEMNRKSAEQCLVPVCRLDALTGKVLATYSCITAAADETSTGASCISRACGLQRSGLHCESNGYCWCYADDAAGREYVDVHAVGGHTGRSGAFAAISQFDMKTGELIAVYSNALRAQNQTDILATSISACCRSFARGYGKRHSAGGYVWKYSTNEDLQAFILMSDQTPDNRAS